MKKFIGQTFKRGYQFYRNNGLLGALNNTVLKLRGGDEEGTFMKALVELEDRPSLEGMTSKSKSSKSITREWLENMSNDPRVGSHYKKTFKRVLYLDDPTEKKKMATLAESIIRKSKHPIYANIKSKTPYLILLPLTWSELQTLAAFRALGHRTAPFTFLSYLAISTPLAVCCSMAEMYVPEPVKVPLKVVKWTGGAAFYCTAWAVDKVTEKVEQKLLGYSLPIDAQETMGTLPKQADLKDLQKVINEYKTVNKK